MSAATMRFSLFPHTSTWIFRFYRLSMDVRRIDWQLYLFRERVQRMLLKLAKTMAAPQAEAQFNAWNQNLDLVISISKYVAFFGCVVEL